MAKADIVGRRSRCPVLESAALALLLFTTPAAASDRYWQLQEVNRAVQSLPLTDCKASSFEAIARLRALGISAVFVAVLTETGSGHAIAVVDGKWALDNRYQRVVSVDQLRRGGYTIAHLRGEP